MTELMLKEADNNKSVMRLYDIALICGNTRRREVGGRDRMMVVVVVVFVGGLLPR